MIRALWNGAVIAESDDTVVLEGNHYFPADSVRSEHLMASGTTTVCPWKGRASYYSLQVGEDVNRDAAWYYPEPSPAARTIDGRIAFWRGVKIEDESDGERRRSVFDRFRRKEISGAARSDGQATPLREAHHRDASVSEVDDASFSAALDGHVTVADFWAPWCGPCKTLHPLFDAKAQEHADDTVHFVRVNVDDSPGVASRLRIMSIPTIVVFDGEGREIDREVGLPDNRRLDQLVRHASALAGTVHDRGAAWPPDT